MPPTRIVRLRDESRRHRNNNPRTRFFSRDSASGKPGSVPSCEIAFVTAYPTIREVCSRVTHPSVAAFAVDEHGVAAHAVFRPHKENIQTAILGRHTSADLFLPDDLQISLRHLALVLHPDSGDVPTYHLVDLRTPLGMSDECGRPVEHVAANGPMFVNLGNYSLIFMPLPWRRTWPTNGIEAWKALPPREYVEEERPLPRHQAVPDVGATGVQVIRGARFARKGLSEEEDVRVGQLQVRSQRGTSSFVLGAKALRGGVLFGRYDRCDNRRPPSDV